MAMLLSGCDPGEMRRRVEEIRKRNAANERACIPLAVRHVRERWLIRDGNWFGKLPDGSLVRLDSPEVTVNTVKKGRPYCCRWMGEIAIFARVWRTDPATESTPPFSMTYTVVVQDSSHIDVVEVSRPDVMLPSQGEIRELAAAQ